MFGLDAFHLARIQFAFTVSFHIIFPAITIGLASYLAVLEGLWLKQRILSGARCIISGRKSLPSTLVWGWSRGWLWPTSSAPTGVVSLSSQAALLARC